MATGTSLGALDWTRVLFEESIDPNFNISKWVTLIAHRPALVLIDCKSVYDSLHQLWSSGAADKRTSIALAIIRDALARDCSKIRWIDTRHQLVDTMTKKGVFGEFLRQTLSCGLYQIVSEAIALERRSALRVKDGSLGVGRESR